MFGISNSIALSDQCQTCRLCRAGLIEIDDRDWIPITAQARKHVLPLNTLWYLFPIRTAQRPIISRLMTGINVDYRMRVCVFLYKCQVNFSLCANTPVISVSLLCIPPTTHTIIAWSKYCSRVTCDCNAPSLCVCVHTPYHYCDWSTSPPLTELHTLCVQTVDLAGAHMKIWAFVLINVLEGEPDIS